MPIIIKKHSSVKCNYCEKKTNKKYLHFNGDKKICNVCLNKRKANAADFFKKNTKWYNYISNDI